MANTDRPNGFTPVGHISGAPWNGATRKFYIAAAYGTRIDVGDVVIAAGSADSRGYPTIELCNTTDPVLGVVTAIVTNPDSLSQVGSPLSTAGYALVCCDPSVVFEAQIDGEVAATDIWMNTKTVVTAGTDAVGCSQSELDYSELATTATLQWKVIGLADRPDNEFGDNAKMLCIINNHQLKGHTGTVGIDS